MPAKSGESHLASAALHPLKFQRLQIVRDDQIAMVILPALFGIKCLAVFDALVFRVVEHEVRHAELLRQLLLRQVLFLALACDVASDVCLVHSNAPPVGSFRTRTG